MNFFFLEAKMGEISLHHRAVPERMHYFGGETAWLARSRRKSWSIACNAVLVMIKTRIRDLWWMWCIVWVMNEIRGCWGHIFFRIQCLSDAYFWHLCFFFLLVAYFLLLQSLKVSQWFSGGVSFIAAMLHCKGEGNNGTHCGLKFEWEWFCHTFARSWAPCYITIVMFFFVGL